jgi:hypothetical protein
MVKQFAYVALVALAAVWPVGLVRAQHHHHHDGHGSGFGIHFGDGGVGIHYEDDHDDHEDHWDHHHHRSRRHHSGWHHSDWHHSDHHHHAGWHFVVPHYDHHYHGTYYYDDGINYYVPRPYVTGSQSYVTAKPVAVEFGGYSHVDDLAGRLERQANELCLELHYNYRHNGGFAQTYREAFQVLAAAKYIHASEHQGDRAEVARRLDEVDGLFHHVQDDVRRWSRRQNRQIGHGGAQAKLELVEAMLHHLMHDVGVKGSHGAPTALPAAHGVEVASPPAN